MKQHFYGKRNHTFQSLYLTTVSPSKMSMPSFFMNISAILSLFLMKSKEFFLSFKFWITVHDFLFSQNIQLFNIWVYFIHVQKKIHLICYMLLFAVFWILKFMINLHKIILYFLYFASIANFNENEYLYNSVVILQVAFILRCIRNVNSQTC